MMLRYLIVDKGKQLNSRSESIHHPLHVPQKKSLIKKRIEKNWPEAKWRRKNWSTKHEINISIQQKKWMEIGFATSIIQFNEFRLVKIFCGKAVTSIVSICLSLSVCVRWQMCHTHVNASYYLESIERIM